MKLTNTTDFDDWFLRRLTQWAAKQLRVPTTRRGRGFHTCRLINIHFGRYKHCWRGTAWRSGKIIVRMGADGYTATKATFTMNGVPIELNWSDMTSDQRRRLCAGETIKGDAGELRRIPHKELIPYYPMQCKYPGRVHSPTYILCDRIEALVQVTAHELAHLARWGAGQTRNREARVDAIALQLLDLFRANREDLLAEWSVPPKVRQAKQRLGVRERNELKARAKLAYWEKRLRSAKMKVSRYKRSVNRYDKIAANKG